jgi:hypothetical protein
MKWFLRFLVLLPALFTARLVLIVSFLLFSQYRSGEFDRDQFVLKTYKQNCLGYKYPYTVLWLARGETSGLKAWREIFACF